MLDELILTDYQVIVRPHPQYVRHFEGRVDLLAEKYKKDGVGQLQIRFGHIVDHPRSPFHQVLGRQGIFFFTWRTFW